MKVLITGGAGYIGSVAGHRLVEAGRDVVVVDNLSQGHVAALPEPATFERIDIVDRDALAHTLLRHRPDAVLHFAALTIAPASVLDPAPYWQTNLIGTLSLLDAMRAAGTTAIVVSSTAAVYGIPEQSPIPEATPLVPINPYGASKLAAEGAVATYASAYGLAAATLRYFNVAGASGATGEDHRPETHLIPSVLDAAAGRRGPLAIYGDDFPTADGTAVRDYVHVDDLIDAHVQALDCLVARGESLPPMNLGTRDGASVRQVIEAVERVTGLSVPTTRAARRPGDPPILVADSSRARELLGWRPQRSTLDEMIGSAWAWRQDHPHGYADQ